MCIRDRGDVSQVLGAMRFVDNHGAATERYPFNPNGSPDGPVSYTHLRAHETVLDLVCRLLLEKKNK